MPDDIITDEQAAPIRKPRKKPAVKKIDPGVLSERRLLDTKIILPQEEPHHRLAKIVLYAMIFGGLAGAVVLFYMNTRTESVQDYSMPQITIPDDLSGAQPPSAAPEPAEPPPAVAVQVVEILATPTGFLNVRQGPGTNTAKIGQVKPGDAYILVSEDTAAGWYQIKLADGSTGWITKQYARVK